MMPRHRPGCYMYMIDGDQSTQLLPAHQRAQSKIRDPIVETLIKILISSRVGRKERLKKGDGKTKEPGTNSSKEVNEAHNRSGVLLTMAGVLERERGQFGGQRRSRHSR